MASIESLKQRMENLDDLQQIVRTMKALSAVSIRQYEQAAAALAEYEGSVELGLRAVLRETPTAAAPGSADADAGDEPGDELGDELGDGSGNGSGDRSDGTAAVIVLGTDHGLCGRFNEVIVEHVQEQVTDAGAVRHWLAVGERVAPGLESVAGDGTEIFPTPSSAAGITAIVQRLLLRVDAWQSEGVERVQLYHNRPTGRSGYEPQGQRLFPLDPARFRQRAQAPWPSRRLPLYTLPRGLLVGHLLRQHYFSVLFRACAESLAAEHGSRLKAMQAAEKNLDERLEDITGRYRRERQAAITSELLDVVAGFEAAS
ncbi:MAG: F0F1 ATP synthase subunit gamma [Gammaproteobacteria bacterium]|jgi:F-type H+-transporting ATPase subunit gamma|nr:F0F1 ATP synthase subunit gamma [Gammaproteobacteria bacterium]